MELNYRPSHPAFQRSPTATPSSSLRLRLQTPTCTEAHLQMNGIYFGKLHEPHYTVNTDGQHVSRRPDAHPARHTHTDTPAHTHTNRVMYIVHCTTGRDSASAAQRPHERNDNARAPSTALETTAAEHPDPLRPTRGNGSARTENNPQRRAVTPTPPPPLPQRHTQRPHTDTVAYSRSADSTRNLPVPPAGGRPALKDCLRPPARTHFVRGPAARRPGQWAVARAPRERSQTAGGRRPAAPLPEIATS